MSHDADTTHSGATTRRRALTLAGALVAGLAGCTDDGGDGGDGMGADDGAGGDGTGADDGTGGDGTGADDGGGIQDDGTDDGETGEGGDDAGGTGDDGGDGGGDGGTELRGEIPTEPSDGAEVAMETQEGQYYFEPEVAWVTPGSTVTFVNESGSHTSTAYAEANDRPDRIPEDAEPWDSGTMSSEGAEFEHTFETEGVYDYFCVPHETLDMLGTVIVGEPDPEAEPGLAEPQEELEGPIADKLVELNQAAQDALGGESE